MWLKRLLCIWLLLLFLLPSVFSQVQSLPSIDLWNNINNSLNWLEQDQLFSQERLKALEKKSQDLEKACQDKEQIQINLENSLKKSEADTRKWKNCSIVLGTTTITLGISTVALILAMVR